MNLSEVLEIAKLSHPGRQRTKNEDSAASDPSIGFAMVADGMGGHRGGEVASAMATQVILERLRAEVGPLEPGEVDDETGYAVETVKLRGAVEEANGVIYDSAQAHTQYAGMGTTVVALLFHDDRVSVAHVGDSRAYRLRGERFEQITTDHSLAQELVDKGFYPDLESAGAAGIKSVITRALGVEAAVAADLQELAVAPEDLYLLCSDGLTDMVSEPEIHLTLRTFSANLNLAAEQLVQKANDNGGRDNISVVLVRPTRPYPAQRGWRERIIDWFI